MSSELTAFGGRLIRWGINTWAWRDGAPAPSVRDLSISQAYNFRCRTYANGTFVEVPCREARGNEDLAWVLAGGYQVGQSGDHVGQRVLHADGRITRAYADARGETTGQRVIPSVYLVPVEDWDARPPCGATWSIDDEAAILGKAASLGWEVPS